MVSDSRRDDVVWTPDPTVHGVGPMAAMMARHGAATYAALHRWSIERPGEFWSEAWEDLGILGSRGTRATAGSGILGTRFFPDARVNVVDTLLAGEGDAAAIVGIDEDGSRRAWSRVQLRGEVAAVALALRAAGVGRGDRVAAWTPNTPEAAIYALGALSIGAVVSTVSPDFGPAGVVDRLGQIEARVLLLSARYSYGGRTVDCGDRLPEVLAGLPTVATVVVVGGAGDHRSWDDWLEPHRGADLRPEPLPFDHPGFILFSSGTTGRPKGIIHSAAGVLIKVLSEQAYHLDIRPADRVLYFTTCGWMMWNWLLCSLGRGATVVLYDGSPAHPAVDRLFAIAAEEKLTFLGLSARLIESIRRSGARPGEAHDLAPLRTVASTGSPLGREAFDFVAEAVSGRVHLASISGGTDICGCFVLGVPVEPVRRGEIQGPALGLDVAVLADDGTEARVEETGELVCRSPFPSVPLGFLGDEDGSRLRAAYFERFPGVWAHGDFAVRTTSGGFRILGRSDATLNANGVRIGTAEIYHVVERFPEVVEALAVGQPWDADTRVVLFVTLQPALPLDADLVERIRRALREQASPRHVPARIVQAPALPRTRSNKLAELAVADAVSGRPVRDTSALANPESLEWFRAWAANDGKKA